MELKTKIIIGVLVLLVVIGAILLILNKKGINPFKGVLSSPFTKPYTQSYTSPYSR